MGILHLKDNNYEFSCISTNINVVLVSTKNKLLLQKSENYTIFISKFKKNL
jgi:hypothetical protein